MVKLLFCVEGIRKNKWMSTNSIMINFLSSSQNYKHKHYLDQYVTQWFVKSLYLTV